MDSTIVGSIIISIGIVIAAWILSKRPSGYSPPTQDWPVGMEGSPVEPSGHPVGPDTYLEVGSKVLSYEQGSWWRAEVMAIEKDDKVRIHFPGWDSTWDTSIPRSYLQVDLPGSAAED